MDISVLKALAAIASTDPRRPQIAGVHIETRDGRAIGVATDGAILVALDLGDAIPDQFIPTTALKSFKRGDAIVSHGRIECGGVTVTFDPADNFPAWRHILPKDPATDVPGQFDAALLERLRKLSVALGGGKYFRVVHSGGNPARVVLPIATPHYALICPLRRVEVDDSLPAWI